MRDTSIAVVGPVMPILHSAGVAYFRSTLLLPARDGLPGPLPSTAVRRLVDRMPVPPAAVTARAVSSTVPPTAGKVTRSPVERPVT